MADIRFKESCKFPVQGSRGESWDRSFESGEVCGVKRIWEDGDSVHVQWSDSTESFGIPRGIVDLPL
jgi:hypothetical protein